MTTKTIEAVKNASLANPDAPANPPIIFRTGESLTLPEKLANRAIQLGFAKDTVGARKTKVMPEPEKAVAEPEVKEKPKRRRKAKTSD